MGAEPCVYKRNADNNQFITELQVLDAAGNEFKIQSNQIRFFNSLRTTFDRVFSYPNPLNPSLHQAKIQFFLQRSSKVSLYIHALNGVLVHEDEKVFNDGLNEFVWNGKDRSQNTLANGVYLAYLITQDPATGDTFKETVKIAILNKDNMSKLIVSIIIYLCLLVSVSFAEVKQVCAIFDSQLGARALGMGKAQTALENQAYSLYSNPAGLRHLQYLEFNAERDSRMAELSTQVLGWGSSLKILDLG